MEGKTRIWIWVGVAVVIIAVLFAVFSRPHANNSASATPTPVFAPQGQLVPQFPQSLILDSNAAVSGSYSVNYSSSTNQYTAEYNSSSSMATLYAQYKQYLPANGWTITNDSAQYAHSRGLYATNASSDVTLTIIPQGSGSQVTISYVTK